MRTNTDERRRKGLVAVLTSVVILTAGSSARAAELEAIYPPRLNIWGTAITGSTHGDHLACPEGVGCFGATTTLDQQAGPGGAWVTADAVPYFGPVATACVPNHRAKWRTQWSEWRQPTSPGLTYQISYPSWRTITCPGPGPIIITGGDGSPTAGAAGLPVGG